ncbi:MAG: cupredoxin domain-containing protein [Hyphomicrobiales bacterium]|nr:cupredoxin domain-containing protein [Hyphomicrobiales bacterium]MDE2114865.1 cupredoxin domain-containing protein [Hyphomicrobiales bacterium]
MICRSAALFLALIALKPVAGAADVHIIMAHDSFLPATLNVHVGDTVVWLNKDLMDHTVTSEDGTVESGGISPGKTFSYTFKKPGDFGYDCSLHANMHGDIKAVP